MSMVFVPHAPVVPPSARAQELGRRIGAVVQEFSRQHADITDLEVRQAMQIALGTAGRGSEVRRVIVAVAAALLAGVALAISLAKRSGSDGATAMIPAVIGALVIFALVVVMILARRAG